MVNCNYAYKCHYRTNDDLCNTPSLYEGCHVYKGFKQKDEQRKAEEAENRSHHELNDHGLVTRLDGHISKGDKEMLKEMEKQKKEREKAKKWQ